MESILGDVGSSSLRETILTKAFFLVVSVLLTFVMIYFRRLVSTLDTINTSLIKLNTELVIIVTEQKGSNDKIKDHEGRLRTLEFSKLHK